MAIRRTTMTSVSRPTSSGSISQSSNTNTALRTTGSRSNTVTNSSNLASLATWNTNCQTPHTSTATSRTAGSEGVLVDINSSNTIVRNDSGSVRVNPTATAEINSTARDGADNHGAIHTVSESQVKKTLAQSGTENEVVKKAFTDVGETGVRNLTCQLHITDQLFVNAENLRAEGAPTSFMWNRPVFTGESVYSINSIKTKNKKKAQQNTIADYMQGMIQKKVSGVTLLNLWDKLSKIIRVSGGVQKKNNKYNKKAIAQMVTDKKYTEGKVINNQNEWQDVKFGSGINSNMKYSGCEIFAAYNAMVKLGEKITGDQLADMITAFEKNGAALKGDFGTSPVAVYSYLYDKYKENSNVDVKMYASNKQKVSSQTVDKIGDQNDIFIASVYNDADKIGAQIHTVCISKEDDGSYTVYNACGGKGKFKEKDGCKSLSDAIDNISTNPQLISLICIDEAELGDFPFIDKYRAIA